MEFTDVSEKRFERAMERLFSGSTAPAASSAGGPSPAKKKKGDEQKITSGLALEPAGVVEPSLASHGCRPWDRGDLLCRLATFKSISWFGKPQVAGPVACARRGWVNVDIDLLACETCGSRLSFPIPPSWPRDEVGRAAIAFAEQLDNAHKGLCTWKNNSCAETLAYFPPTPVADLRVAYNDRCEALLQLSALPMISENAKFQMKVTRGPQVEKLLSEPSSSDPEFLNENGVSSSSSRNTLDNGFYQAQRMISLCGWEPRLLPYSVDREDRLGPESNERIGTSQGPGPSVTLHLKGDLQANVTQSQTQPHADASDPASAVLDCSLCGASVGLWNFATVNRPAPLLDSGLKEILTPQKKHVESDAVQLGADGVNEGPELATAGAPDALCSKAPEAPPIEVSEIVSPQKGVLDLRLTIAGGPRPTRLKAPVSVPPAFGTSHVEQLRRSEAENHDRSLPADQVEGILVDAREQAEGGMFLRNSKRKREEGSQWPGPPVKQPLRALPHASSVNAIDTYYLQKQANSMESVDYLLADSDGQGGNTAEYHGNDLKSLLQAEPNIFHDYDIDVVKSKIDGRLGVGTLLEPAESVAEFGTDAELMEEFVSGRGLMDDFVPDEGGNLQASVSQTFIKDSLSAGPDEGYQENEILRGGDTDAKVESTIDTSNAVIQDHDVDAALKEVTEKAHVQRNEEVQSHPLFPPGSPLEDVRKLETKTREFDPIRQHRHFCPWINGHVASATGGAGTGTLCGWQVLLDALQHQHGVHGHVESELGASKHKDDALLSVRKFLGCVSSSPPPKT